jgi:hypothetical protein
MAGVVVVLGLVAAGCSSPGSIQDQMQSWVSSTGYGPSTGSLVHDAQKAQSVLSAGEGVNAAHTVCAVLLLESESANGNLPAPDPTTTSLLSKAYDALGAAANACYSASTNASALTAFGIHKSTGLALLAEANARIEAVIGRTVSTSTTADNGSLAQ